MNIVTTLHFRTISVTIAFLVLQHSAKYTLGQLDSNVNTLRYDGEVNIGVLVSLHKQQPGHEESSKNILTSRCSRGELNTEALQQVIAAKWAVDVINLQSGPHDLKIGVQLHDACESMGLTRRHLYSLITATREVPGGAAFGVRISGPPLLGVIGIGAPVELSETTGALHAFNIPLIAVGHKYRGKKYDNILSTSPDVQGQAKALANIVYEMNVDQVAVITEDDRATVQFLTEATYLNIKVTNVLEFKEETKNVTKTQALNFINGLEGPQPVIVMILDALTVLEIAESISKSGLNNIPIWIMATVGLRQMDHILSWKKVFNGGVVLEPYLPELEQFQNYFQHALLNSRHSMKSLLNEYKSSLGIQEPIVIDPHVANIVKAVSALTAAFRLVQLDRCKGHRDAACLRELHADKLHEAILANLKKLSFQTMGSGQLHDAHPNHHHFTPDGRLISTKRLVYIVDGQEGLQRVGWYSDNSGLHIDLDEDGSFPDYYEDENEIGVTQIPKFTEKVRSSPLVTNSRSKFSTGSTTSLQPIATTTFRSNNPAQNLDVVSRPLFSYKDFVSRTWAIIVMTVAILGFCISMFMLTYVLLKICDGSLTGQQAMGLMLMIGVTGLFGSVIPWLLPPNEMSCAARHFLHPLLMALCFSVLLVKAMQLRSLVAVGLGGRIPQINQLVSLAFMVIVQVVISCEWYMMNKPIGYIETDEDFPKCNVSRNRFLILHSYPAALLIIAFCYGVSVLKIKTNFHEGRWITAASISMLPVYAVWMLICYCAPGHFHDPATAVSIILLALMMLFIVFIPKLYTINQQMKLEDSKDIFYSQQTSLNDSTLQSGSHSYGHHGPGGHHPAYGHPGHPPPGHHGGHPGAGPPGHHFGGGKNGKHPRNGFYPTFSYATNYNYPRHPHAASFPRQRAGPHPNAMLHKGSKNKVIHIHGTNGAKFNGTNFFGTREPTCTYEEWHNPASAYNTNLNAEKLEKRIKRSKSNNSARSDIPRASLQRQNHPEFHGVHLGTPQPTDKERKRNSRSNSKSSSQSSPSYGCTVKGASAIILTPDSIVYNDDGIWSHRYDTSPRP